MRKIQLQTSICRHRRAKPKRFSKGLIQNTFIAMKTLDEFIDIELSAGDMNQILGGSAYDECITCTPKGNHVDANDMDDTEAFI